MQNKLMTGIDLHSNNMHCGIMDAQGRRVFHRKLPCQLSAVLAALKPFQESIDKIAIESTYNWYWLVDGLEDAGYSVVLANPSGMSQYDGLKYTDDESDCFFLAELLRLNILPTGHICNRQMRPIRDVLRRRMGLVQKRTSLILGLKGLHTRVTGQSISLSRVKAMSAQEGSDLFTDESDQLTAGIELRLIGQLDEEIELIEKHVLTRVAPLPSYRLLQTLPGVGKILGLTIMLETHDIARFPTAGDYASYGRCVESKRISNKKKKGKNNAKCGNPYLSWAWVEAANFARRFDEQCRRFYDRKAAQVNTIVATKALACKLAKAAWFIMTTNKPYDPQLMFPSPTKSTCCLGMGDKNHLDNGATAIQSPGTIHQP